MANRRWRSRFSSVATIIFLAGAASSQAGSPCQASGPARDRVLVRSKLGAGAVRAALVGAGQRLAEPACATIFTDYADAFGRKLQENLDALGQTGPGYLQQIVFADGYGLAR